jgi:signal transduction histidine kinase
LGLNIS